MGARVDFIIANHDPLDPSRHEVGQDIDIGPNCWVGMNAVILPGVVLGEGTVVGAGSVVTKRCPEGHCNLAGAPAKVVKRSAE